MILQYLEGAFVQYGFIGAPLLTGVLLLAVAATFWAFRGP